ncbi:uncharacterized protein LOC129968447 isoform X2 [Argiope bruennichi]|uniref:Uncharacterized protein n=1 Tax=Argiope bruennichi TaxID=94029 RepID=A0A8T0FPB6_ARGBR|nr:uncharacterized protein LOC129968447 isoform X2 [Argiope bruennichi]XP_055938289.1 uncharacterized protein LOC129968447 isoform X2 [Argiope bruennichi]KAF8792018.1 hypothetical protein HNY73_003670 [Argiope bruennichi]
MNFSRVQTLLDISLAKITIEICNNFELCSPCLRGNKLEVLYSALDHWNYAFCDICLNSIKKRASLLQLPRELEKEVAALSKYVYNEMVKFKICLVKLHRELLPNYILECSCLDQIDFAQIFRWESTGIVDEKKTIEILVCDESLDLHFRFVLACYFCLEDHVTFLWGRMPEITKLDNRAYTCTSLPLVSFWLKWLDREINQDSIDAIYNSFFKNSSFDGILKNTTLLSYIVGKIYPNQRKIFLRDVALQNWEQSKITRFCLFRVDEEQQCVIFQDNPREVLISFLDWPWQKHFMGLAHFLYNDLQERDYFFVMWEFWGKIVCHWYDYDYVALLMEFWNHSPEDLKEFIRNEHGDLMRGFIRTLEADYNFHGFY